MKEIIGLLEKYKLIPVVVLSDKEKAIPLAKALIEGGLPCAEVTFRTEAAKEVIQIMSMEYPEMLIGAGTVLTIDQAKQAVEAGAKFIVSPGFNPKVVEYCVHNNIPIIPGCSNPSDIEQALDFDLEIVKFFPAEAAGGVKMIKALSDPYSMVRFMPTGGINQDNILSYLDCKSVIACGGSWIVSKDLIEQGNFEEIKELTKAAVKLVNREV